ncbi:PEP-CTERM sorting domain-containing protein [Planctomyces sp. SH-PL62]|uniref:PEP-CTERM sorting domain-containing protein n=1 Tax=Planctomyces sp. SH-PL62 TaxID=1636152 RepID=UPI00078C2B6B|nr:PEP-CTERM sorting domain-containing protein [Planctomyces sp. SH-PL62]AMV40612.1 hypothetical protein VT85_24490 [Planctomyces sp. SH-PL62]
MGFVVPPSKWEVQHAKQIFAAQAYQSANNGQLPDTNAWRALEFRHSLNPGRFNFYHPNVGRLIELGGAPMPPSPPAQQGVKDWEGHMRGPEATTPVVPTPADPQVLIPPTIIPPVVPPPIVTPPIVTPPVVPPLNPPAGQGGTTPPGPTGPQAVVPEPATFLMFAVAILTVGLFFQRARRRPR